MTENGLVTYKAYMQYILKLLCGYLYHPTSSVLTLRQRRNTCTIQHDCKRRDIPKFSNIFFKGCGGNI